MAIAHTKTEQGLTVSTGTGSPTHTAVAGDRYTDTSNGNTYQYTTSWKIISYGSGTTNTISKFTSTGTIGDSLITDNGTYVSIGSSLVGGKLNIGNETDGSTGIVVTAKKIGVSAFVQGTASFPNYEPIGVQCGSQDGQTAIGIVALAGRSEFGSVTQVSIGGYFDATYDYGGGDVGTYGVQIIDGTQGTGKVLTSMNNSGQANWTSINILYLSPTEIYRGITFNNNSTTIQLDGGVVLSTSASTLAQSVASTNLATKQIRLRFYASVVSGGRYTGTRGTALLWYLHGGFRFVCDFNISDTSYSAGCQQFYGLAGQTTDLNYGSVSNILVSTLTNIIGVGNEVGDTNLQVFYNDATGTASKIDLGVGFPANRTVGAISTTVYSIILFNEPMSTSVTYLVINKETGVQATGVISTNLPATSQGLNFFASRCMSVTSVTNTGQFDLMKLGVNSQL